MIGRVASLWKRLRRASDVSEPLSQRGPTPSAPWATGLLCTLVVAYAAFFSWLTIMRHQTFQSGAMDLGYTDQVVWNTLHGRFFEFSTYTEATIDLPLDEFRRTDTLLSYHVEPLLAPISLLYLLWDSPLALLVLQSVAIALGAIPTYLLGRDHLGSHLAGLAFAALWLLAPAVQGANLADFHTVALAAPTLLWAWRAAQRRRFGSYLVLSLVAMAAREDVSLLVMMMGLYVWIIMRERRAGLVAAAAGATWFILCGQVILPYYNGLGSSPFLYRMAIFAPTLRESAAAFLADPSLLVDWMAQPGIVAYLTSLLASGGFLSLLSPLALLPATPVAVVNVFSTWSWTYSGGVHYSISILPFVMVSAIMGLGALDHLLRGADRLARGPSQPPRQPGKPAPHDEQGASIPGGAGTPARGLARPDSSEDALRQAGKPALHDVKEASILGSAGTPARDLAQPDSSGDASRQDEEPALQERVRRAAVPILACLALAIGAAQNFRIGMSPWSRWYTRPTLTDHHQVVHDAIDLIPPAAAVSAQSNLYPHIAHRHKAYFYPALVDAEYVLLDVTSTPYPVTGPELYGAITRLCREPGVRILQARDGVLLLQREQGDASAWPLPGGFYTFARAPNAEPEHLVGARFGDAFELVGYDWSTLNVVSTGELPAIIATYWRALEPQYADMSLHLLFTRDDGAVTGQHDGRTAATLWYGPSEWEVGETVRVESPILPVGRAAAVLVAVTWPGADPLLPEDRIGPITGVPADRLLQDGSLLELFRPVDSR